MGRKAKRDPNQDYVAVNVKLRAELLPKIKALVGREMANLGTYVSQQDLLERYIEERVNAEFDEE